MSDPVIVALIVGTPPALLALAAFVTSILNGVKANKIKDIINGESRRIDVLEKASTQLEKVAEDKALHLLEAARVKAEELLLTAAKAAANKGVV